MPMPMLMHFRVQAFGARRCIGGPPLWHSARDRATERECTIHIEEKRHIKLLETENIISINYKTMEWKRFTCESSAIGNKFSVMLHFQQRCKNATCIPSVLGSNNLYKTNIKCKWSRRDFGRATAQLSRRMANERKSSDRIKGERVSNMSARTTMKSPPMRLIVTGLWVWNQQFI